MDRCLIIILLFAYGTSGFHFPKDQDLYEGNDCKLENGNIGVCKKLPECPSRIADVKAGKRTTEGHGRCGFENSVEIVCCPIEISAMRIRPADKACWEYGPGANHHRYDDWKSIYGGERAERGEFPYMAALGYENTNEDIHHTIVYICGGTLISPHFVLTAAHCVSNIHNQVPVHVRLGEPYLWSVSDFAQIIPVGRIIIEPHYKRSENYHDIALIELSRPASMEDNVRPVCLETNPSQSLEMDEFTLIVALGHGYTGPDNELSDHLLMTGALSMVPKNECSRSYNRFGGRLPSGLADSMICAIDTDRKRSSDACQGDSGGPLLLIDIGYSGLIGVTSFGLSCGTPIPAVWTAVYPYLEWIERNVWPEYYNL